MKKYIVETYYTCTFKTVHSLNNLDETELTKIDQRTDGEVELIDVKLNNRKTKKIGGKNDNKSSKIEKILPDSITKQLKTKDNNKTLIEPNGIKLKNSSRSKMPQGNIKQLDFDNPLDIKAYQYDIVCNGIELSSGAIRNHIPELMYKLFSIAGYNKKDVDEKFSGMINALSYGAPPHGGIAPGIDRIVMMLAEKENIREITLFPMNQNAQDLMMQAPSEVKESQLKELSIKKDIKKN